MVHVLQLLCSDQRIVLSLFERDPCDMHAGDVQNSKSYRLGIILS